MRMARSVLPDNACTVIGRSVVEDAYLARLNRLAQQGLNGSWQKASVIEIWHEDRQPLTHQRKRLGHPRFSPHQNRNSESTSGTVARTFGHGWRQHRDRTGRAGAAVDLDRPDREIVTSSASPAVESAQRAAARAQGQIDIEYSVQAVQERGSPVRGPWHTATTAK